MKAKVETLEAGNGKSVASNWSIVSFDTLSIDIFETNPLRASSYIPTPNKYAYPKSGLINI